MQIEIEIEKLFTIMRKWVADGWVIEYRREGKPLKIDMIEQLHIGSFRLFSPDWIEDGHNALCVFGRETVVLVKGE
jgi:hypothetical protein